MKIKCLRCKKEFFDNYKNITEDNRRIYCDGCVDILWEEWKKKDE